MTQRRVTIGAVLLSVLLLASCSSDHTQLGLKGPESSRIEQRTNPDQQRTGNGGPTSQPAKRAGDEDEDEEAA